MCSVQDVPIDCHRLLHIAKACMCTSLSKIDHLIYRWRSSWYTFHMRCCECCIHHVIYLCCADGQKNNDQDYSSFTTFGKSRVTDVARDGSITFTFEEDEDDDAQALSSKLLSSS